MASIYATTSIYRAVIELTDGGKDDEILKDLEAVSRYIDGKLGRYFGKDDEDIARVYIIPEKMKGLWIDDLSAAPSALKIDGDGDGEFETVLSPSDYDLLPLNALKEPEPRPYVQILLTPWGSRSSFYKNERVEVTGEFGWPQIPKAIERATIHLTAILRLETPRATRRIPELGDVVEASADAMSIVRQLMDRYQRVRYS